MKEKSLNHVIPIVHSDINPYTICSGQLSSIPYDSVLIIVNEDITHYLVSFIYDLFYHIRRELLDCELLEMRNYVLIELLTVIISPIL
jgi:hypothetical protein